MDERLMAGLSLVIGSSLSGYDFHSDQILTALKNKFGEKGYENINNIFSYVNAISKDHDISGYDVRSYIKQLFSKGIVDAVIERIASRPWRSIISIALDEKLREGIELEINRRVTTRTLSFLSAKGVPPTPGSFPYYALLGSINDERKECSLSLTYAEYLERRRDWRDLLRSFPDYNKAASLVFIGTNRDVSVVADLINELLSLSPGLPSKLVFFKGDPCATDPSILSLLPSHVEVQVLDTTLRKWVEDVDKQNRQLNLPLGSIEGINYRLLSTVGDKLTVVPRERDLGDYDPSSHNRVMDYLFRPSELNWEPYRQALDFPRDVTSKIKEAVDKNFSSGLSGVVSLSGEAGVGKTIVMRRLAYDYANRGFLSLWLRKSLGYRESLSWFDVVKRINDALSNIENPQVLLFLDGAFGRTDQVDDLVRALSNESFNWSLILCRRKTDEAFANEDLFSSDFSGVSGCNLMFPNELEENELDRLPAYLVSIRAAQSIETAQQFVKDVAKRNAADVLCALWYLLPQTRGAISGSLSDEYFSLGGVEGMVQQFAKESASKKDWARRAYELVTACSGLDLAIPVEVLVRALEIGYGDWLDACLNGQPLWGLLYDESYKNGESFAYRTRNEVVTNVLLKTLNGGFDSHIGEFRCFKSILLACELGTPVYREFASSILIGKKRELMKRFNFEQGLELFDAAITSIPYDDRALVHHRGIWIKDVGGDLSEAYKAISQALKVEDYPYSDRGESLGNIHTSLASCVVKDLEKEVYNHQEYQARLDVIEDHLRQAEKFGQFDLYNRHVSANMFIKVAQKFKGVDEELHFASMASAVRIISSSLSLVSDRLQRRHPSYYESLQLLHNLEEQLFQVSDNFDENDRAAMDAFEKNRNQTGFYVLLKILISEAASKGKGRLYKRVEEYLQKVTGVIYKANEELDPRIIECRADLEIKWHLLGKSSVSPKWEHLESDLKIAIEAATQSTPIMLEFYRAVALFHLGDVPDAEAIFNQLRRHDLPGDVRRARRCFYIDKNGNPKYLQGQIKQGYNRRFVFCSELSSEFMCANEFAAKEGALVHYYLAFSLQGPIAIKNVPHD